MTGFSVRVEGWREGFRKVQASKLLREELGFSITEAKGAVDRILAGEHVVLVCPTSAVAVYLEAKLEDFGANVVSKTQ